MNKKEIAGILDEIGIILELKGENPFKARAYHNGARIIETLEQDLKSIIDNGKLSLVKGIGQALAEKITILVTDGRLPYYEELKASIPPGLMQMLAIQGLGTKKVRAIYDSLKISTIGELEYACRENRLRDLPGFGQKSQQSILKNIEQYQKNSERFLYPVAEQTADTLLLYLKKNPRLVRVEIAGSLRRKAETVKDINIVGCCANKDRDTIMAYFVAFQLNESTINQGNTQSAIIVENGMTAELRLVREDEFPFLLQYRTGSEVHYTHLRQLAKKAGLSLNEYSLIKDDKPLVCRDEEQIYSELGLDYIQPVLREDLGEIEAAAEQKLPVLYSGEPFFGLFHVHSTYSDGANSLEEIAGACKTNGLNYVGICDHSKSAFYANGLTEERLIKQLKEIDALNEKDPVFTIFKGIEVDILPDGNLDYKDDVLAGLDFVIASVHSNFKLSETEQTNRIAKALKNRYVTMLGHPTGRLLLAREGYKLDMEEIIKIAAEEGKVIEINSSPYRLDIDWRWGKLAQKMGIKTALNPDAHSIEGLKHYQYGIGIAQKGWFRKEDVLNSYNTDEIKKFFEDGIM